MPSKKICTSSVALLAPITIHPDKSVDEIIAHLTGLSDDSKYTRFFSSVTDEYIERYVHNMAPSDTCFGIYSGHKLVAFAHIGQNRDSYDLGISVDDHCQGKGLAKQLMRRVIVWCKANGIDLLTMECLRENTAMKNLAKSLGFSVVIDDYSAISAAAIKATFAEKLSAIAQNLAFENISLVDSNMRAQYKMFMGFVPRYGND